MDTYQQQVVNATSIGESPPLVLRRGKFVQAVANRNEQQVISDVRTFLKGSVTCEELSEYFGLPDTYGFSSVLPPDWKISLPLPLDDLEFIHVRVDLLAPSGWTYQFFLVRDRYAPLSLRFRGEGAFRWNCADGIAGTFKLPGL